MLSGTDQCYVDISYFRSNPLPFYTLAHELDPSRYKPTISHCFVRLLSDKGLLLKLFTQNIDCLERKAGVPDEKIVEAHGSFARQRCIECHKGFPDHLMEQAIQMRQVPHCTDAMCNGLVKPDIVFFGEALPEAFHQSKTLPMAADLAIIMGTSLRVHPFASLPGLCSEGVPRLLVNSERVGGLGYRADDVLLLGDCDEGVRRLASAIGWLEELEALFEVHHPKESSEARSDAPKTKDDKLDDEIAKITKDVDNALRISSKHTADLEESLSLPSPGPGHQESDHQSSQSKELEKAELKEEERDKQDSETANSEPQGQSADSAGSKSSL